MACALLTYAKTDIADTCDTPEIKVFPQPCLVSGFSPSTQIVGISIFRGLAHTPHLSQIYYRIGLSEGEFAVGASRYRECER